MKHEEIKAKINKEIQDVLGERPPTFEDVPKLVYTGQVIDEVLRMYPSTWLFARKALSDFSLNGFAIPAKSMLFLSPYITHRDNRFWQNPEQFSPERFSEENKKERHAFCYFPFGGGPRYCIGDMFALTVMKLVIVMVCQKFEMKMSGPDVVIEPMPKATLRPNNRLLVQIEKNY